MLRGALVTALVASSLARGGDAIGADDRSRAGGSRPNADAVVVEPLDLINVLRDVSEEGSGVAFGAASRRPLARSSAPDRDNGSCDIHALSRFADPAARAPLWGGGASQPTHPSVVRFMNAQGWRDPQLVVPRPGDGAPERPLGRRRLDRARARHARHHPVLRHHAHARRSRRGRPARVRLSARVASRRVPLRRRLRRQPRELQRTLRHALTSVPHGGGRDEPVRPHDETRD